MTESFTNGCLYIRGSNLMMCPPVCSGTIVFMSSWRSKFWTALLSQWFLCIWWWRQGVSPQLVLSGLVLVGRGHGCLAPAFLGMVGGGRSKLLGALRPLAQDPFLLSQGGGDSFLAQVPLPHSTHLLSGWRRWWKRNWTHYLPFLFFLSFRSRWGLQSVVI